MARKKSRTKQATTNGCRLPNGIEGAMVDFAYKCALDDAMQRGANQDGAKTAFADADTIKELVEAFVADLFAGENPQVLDYARRIAREDKSKKLTFGHIQKVLNMTAKYMYFACYRKPELRTCFQASDCPMDRKMISRVRQEYKKWKQIAKNKPIPDVDDKECPASGWGALAWSDIGFPGDKNSSSYSYYERFQKMVKEVAKSKDMNPIEYDFWLWNQL